MTSNKEPSTIELAWIVSKSTSSVCISYLNLTPECWFSVMDSTTPCGELC
jgi:hypothetical protein